MTQLKNDWQTEEPPEADLLRESAAAPYGAGAANIPPPPPPFDGAFTRGVPPRKR